jgi:hypothetical protein
VKESTSGTAENQKPQINKTAEYNGGSVDYSVIEGSAEHNPILIVPGFTGGRTALQSFANELNDGSGRQVIFPDQPVLDKQQKNGLPIIDHHALALLSIIKNEKLEDSSVDFITHSLGAMIAVRAAELAKVQGIKSFESREGSHAIFVAPAGSNDKENIIFLGGRWVKFITKDTFYREQLDPTGEMKKAGQKNFSNNLGKTAKEVLELRKKSTIYSYIGDTGLKPFVLGYANDSMFPDKVIRRVLENSGTNLAGYSVPIDNGGVGAGNFEEFKAKTGLRSKEARQKWAHHYRNANHADLQYHPERTVKAILQVIDR